MEVVFHEIRAWLFRQPDWLQDAAERILKNGALREADCVALAALIKTPEGQRVTTQRKFDELVKPDQINQTIRILSIGPVVGIENLAPRKPLAIGKGNLTVIYGHNGSGKSSYTRILKCAAGKPRATLLKSNVFVDAPVGQSCTICISVSDQPKLCEWLTGGGVVEELRSIDVFDSDEATHYLKSESAASYTPPVVSLFESLATGCDSIKRRLQSEQDKLVSGLPILPNQYDLTISGKAYKGLKFNTTKQVLADIATWTAEHDASLAAITERLKVVDHAGLARAKRAKKREIERVVSALQGSAKAYGAENIVLVRGLRADAIAKRRIAEQGAKVTTSKFDGVGTHTWKALWEAARAYSQTAYPGRDFPVVDDARCVLCHQELTQDAQHRLREFESFVVGALETDARTAERVLSDALTALPLIPTKANILTQCQAAELGDDWIQYLERFWASADEVKKRLVAQELQNEVQAVDDVSEATRTLQEYWARLEVDAVSHDNDALAFDRAKATKEKLELEAKRWVAQQIVAVTTEIERLKAVKDYEGWKSLANSRVLSNKANEISAKVITDAYVSRFNRELTLLGADRLRVELVKSKIEKGRILHRVQLRGRFKKTARGLLTFSANC
ncbi:AAA family ATPase [Robbsia andropogonis]|uniref:AAA family ATPase n=1 Tax=Robbsia andropogonis TaxID=28092 RepID=UPI002A6B5C1F|nr:hypothetical protein [Robbsia andropogonis]